MPANKYALLRYRIIDKCIGNKYKPYPTKERLREACEEALYGSGGERISESTIEKDIWAMRNDAELGYYAPIKYDKRYGGYRYEDPDYSIDSIPLNDDDLNALNFAALTLQQFRDTSIFQQFGFAIDKLSDRLAIQPQMESADMNVVQFESAPHSQGSEWLEQLLAAIRGKQELTVEYAAYKGAEQKTYTYHPYLLKEYRNRWYVTGKDQKDRIITLGLDRIKSLSPTKERFAVVKEFDPDLYFKYSLGITQYQTSPEQIKLWFSPFMGNYIKSQPIHESQEVIKDDADGLEIKLNLLVTHELVALVLSYGAEVKVLSEGELKKRVEEQVEKMAKTYRV